MDLILDRYERAEDGIFSHLADDGDMIRFTTLEHAYEEGSLWRPKIPDGTYKCIRGMHRLEHMTEDFETFEILGVEGHTRLLFHWGNYNEDSKGCILVGGCRILDADKNQRMITQSRGSFTSFMKIQEGCESFMLTVRS